MRRKVIVTLVLAAIGAIFGAALGALSLWVANVILRVGQKATSDVALLAAGAQAGALAGAALAPISAWALMRHTPLWRAIGEPVLGTALGSIAGTFAASRLHGDLAWTIVGGLLGFLIAAIRLRFAFGGKTKTDTVTTS
jgi:hypothetical protein